MALFNPVEAVIAGDALSRAAIEIVTIMDRISPSERWLVAKRIPNTETKLAGLVQAIRDLAAHNAGLPLQKPRQPELPAVAAALPRRPLDITPAQLRWLANAATRYPGFAAQCSPWLTKELDGLVSLAGGRK